jgi:hypothetical protein
MPTISTDTRTIQVRYGTEAQILATVLNNREPAYATDTKYFFVGDGVTAGGIKLAKFSDVPSLTGIHQVPAGGTANQVLAKIDSDNYNIHWLSIDSTTATITPTISGITNTATINAFLAALAQQVSNVLGNSLDWKTAAGSFPSTLYGLFNQNDTATMFIPAGSTFSPPTRASRNRTYNYLYVDCCDSAGVAQNPTSLTVSIYQNGSSVYTSGAITTGAFTATISLTISAGDLIRVVVSNTTGLTGGVSVTPRMVNR